MNQHDDELQKNIEQGVEPMGDDLDVHAYRVLFSRLKREPDFHLPINFSDSVVTRVIEKRKREASREFLWFGAGMFLLLIAFVVAVALSGFKPNFGFLKNMSSYLGLLIFGVAFILSLQFLDKKIITNKNSFGEIKKAE